MSNESTVEKLLGDLAANNIRLALTDKGELAVRGDKQRLTGALVAQIKANKAAIIVWLDAGKTGQTHSTIRRIERDQATYPLSFSQQRLWFLDQMTGASEQYNMSSAFWLHGVLNRQALQQALNELFVRHEVLHSVYVKVDGVGRQKISINPAIAIRTVVADNESQLPLLVAEEARRGFNLQTDAMLRCCLIELAGDSHRHVMTFTMHHIASDEWSLNVAAQEFMSLYQKAIGNQSAPLAPMPLQYIDYAHWQQQYLSSEAANKSLAFFSDYLDGAPDVHNLPTSFVRPAQQSFAGAVFSKTLSPELSSKLRRLAQAQNVTLFFLMHSIYALLLAKYSGEDDIVIGTPVAGRDDKALQSMIGFFVNTVPLRCRIDGQQPFAQFLKANREQILGVFEHQAYPFDALVEKRHPERSMSYSPVLQLVFTAMDNRAEALQLPGLTVEGFDLAINTAKFDLSFAILDAPEGIECHWNYATSLFTQIAIEQLQGALAFLAESVCKAPNTPLEILSLVGPKAQQQLLEQLNESHPPLGFSHVPQRFAQMVADCGDEMAALDCQSGRTLSYTELDKKSQAVAHWLQQNGLQKGELVGLFVERSLDMLVGMLAILKAGGGYLPLDTSNPQSRTEYILGDSQLQLILCQQALADKIGDVHFSGRSLCLDSFDYPDVDNALPELELSEDALAYVIYTSGSTGQPKGVMVNHGNILNLVLDNQFYRPNKGDIVAQCANHAFDAATFEIWGALLHGNRLALISRDQLLDPQVFADTLIEHKVDVLFLTTAVFNQGVTQAVEGFTSLRYLLFGGEAVDISTVNQLIAAGKPEHLLHVYGPTETTTYSTWYEIDRPRQDTFPIGIGLSGHSHYILDKNGHMVPQGAVGELYIGGCGVADGYWRKPQMTDKVFIDNPWAKQTGHLRLYKTGDLVRLDEQGQIVYIGRVDNQVKLRGFRIELSEIANQCRHMPSVEDAFVMLLGEGSGRYLAAYLQAPNEIDGDALIASCQDYVFTRLPDYMRPTAYLVMEKLPVTANGKIDHRALPEPKRVSADVASREANSETEIYLAKLWQSLLQSHELPGCGQNFFKLGGHSLLATRMQSAISEQRNVRLPIRAFFDNPTIEALALMIEQTCPALQSDIPHASRAEPLPLSFAQQRLWFIDQMQGQSVEYNMPVVMQLDGALDIERLQWALDTIVERHEVLRTNFKLEGHQAVQVIKSPRAVRVVQVDLRHVHGPQQQQQIAQQVREEIGSPFCLAQDLMIRARLLLVASQRFVLVVNMHHIASDGWSMEVITNEFIALYGGQSALSTLPLQYADYAKWQQDQMIDADSRFSADMDYWRQQLQDAPQVHNLPLDHKRPPVQSMVGKNFNQVFDSGLTQGLKQLALQQDVTLFMLMHSLFSVLLSRYSGESDIFVGTPVAGREHPALTEMVGFFVNNLVLRTQMDGELSLQQYLAQNKSTILDAFSHQEVPFDYIVEKLKPQRSMSHTPLYQISFSLQNADRPMLQIPGLEISGIEYEEATAKFDLNLTVIESAHQLTLVWQYATALFDAKSIENMAASMACIAEAAVANVHTRVARLPLLDKASLSQIYQGHGPLYSPVDEPIIHLAVAAQASKSPDAIAAEFNGQSLSYGELEQKSNQLAHFLVERGVAPGQMVVLFVERGVHMLVGMLGILKAGGAYVPFDTGHPQSRMLHVLEDTKAKLILTEHSLTGLLPPCFGGEKVMLDDCPALAEQPLDAPPAVADLSADSLAYVIYTSGSTGKPKGVMVSHKNVMRLIDRNNYVHFSADDVIAQSSNHSFDAATFEIWGTLIHGAKMVGVSKEQMLDPLELNRVLQRHGVTILFLTTALLNQMAYAKPDGFAGLRYLLAGGEAVDVDAFNAIFKHSKPDNFLHVYGPTENTTYSTFYPVTHVRDDTFPIGKSISGSTHYVLDKYLQPVPQGVVGELYVGGDGIARGYLNRDELTKSVFIDNPFRCEKDPGIKIYKTGDLVRVDSHGDIVYVDRVDHQVKLRGFRIELGEIEAALRDVQGVSKALVLVTGDGVQKRIVAWVTSDEQAEPLIDRARTALAGQLPDYMVPSAIVVLKDFILTHNGKIDRRQLPQPEISSESEYVAPNSETEIVLCGLWHKLFDSDRIGIEDNFFEIGGHSILATRLVADVNEQFSVQLSIRDIFEHQTIRTLALCIEQADVAAAQDAIGARFDADDDDELEELEL